MTGRLLAASALFIPACFAQGAPSVQKSFTPNLTAVGATSTMTFIITNPNAATTLTSIQFSDTLPAGLIVANAPNLTTTCDPGTMVAGATAGSGMLSVSIPSLMPAASCSIAINVTPTAGGDLDNTTSPVSSTESGPGARSNTATLFVFAPPILTNPSRPP